MSKSRPKYPVSADCPECGSEKYKRVKPEAELAFASDRVCKKCGTRYTPPTPAWAKGVYAGLGLVFLAVGVGLGFWFLSKEPVRMKGVMMGFVGGPAACIALLYKAFTTK